MQIQQTTVREWRHRQSIERGFDIAVIFAAICSIPLVIEQLRGRTSLATSIADWIIWFIFFLDYVVSILFAATRMQHARRRWLNLVIVVVSFPTLPHVLSISRLVRLSRLSVLLRLILVALRGTDALRDIFARRGLMFTVLLTTLIIVIAGLLMSLLEPEVVKGGFGSGVWWAIVTTSTVGYGDISPTTTTGRIVAGVLMLAGIGLVSTLAASTAAYFVGTTSMSELQDVTERIERIEHLLIDRHVGDERIKDS